MSSSLDTRKTALEIVNAVLIKLGTLEVTALNANQYSKVYTQLLNEVISEVDDAGDWEERYSTVDTNFVSGQDLYSIDTPEPVKRIDQVFALPVRAPMKLIKKQDMTYLKLNDSTGTPRQYCIWGVDTKNNPLIRVYPKPNTSNVTTLTVFYYEKTPNLTTNDGDVYPVFPANVLIKGLYYKALMEQNDGERSAPVQIAEAEYKTAIMESLNRFTNDTGNDVRIVPNRM